MPVGDGIIEFWEQSYLQIFGLMMIEKVTLGKVSNNRTGGVRLRGELESLSKHSY